jgi:hypothetical protein
MELWFGIYIIYLALKRGRRNVDFSSKYSDGQFWKITAENVIARQEGDFPVIDPCKC